MLFLIFQMQHKEVAQIEFKIACLFVNYPIGNKDVIIPNIVIKQ
jgi:hypothetical protein